MTLRTIFMGTPEMVVPVLDRLAERTAVQLVVTQPDARSGRGRKVRPPAAKLAAERLDIPVWQPETLRGAEGDDRLQGADLFVVFAYGEILRQPVLDLPSGDCINIHASLLPRWRGASPLQAAIRAGDAQTGISIMSMVRALDAGAVYRRDAIDLPADATLPWLHDALAELAVTSLDRFLDDWPHGEAESQDEAEVTVCGKLVPADGQIDWQQPAAAIEAQVRAYTPAPGCWTTVAGERMRILALALADADAALAPGQVLVSDGQALVGCGAGTTVAIERLQAAGRKPMAINDFLNGQQLPTQFGD